MAHRLGLPEQAPPTTPAPTDEAAGFSALA